MQIKLIREKTGKELVKELKKTYGSIEGLRRHMDMKALIDLEDWEYFSSHPDELIREMTATISKEIPLTKLDLELLEAIKKNHPKSIRELSRMIGRNIKNVYQDVASLKEKGLISFEQGTKRAKIPIANYDKIEIEI